MTVNRAYRGIRGHRARARAVLPRHRPGPASTSRPCSRKACSEIGADGRAALAWDWALTGTRPSPVTLSLRARHGRRPARRSWPRPPRNPKAPPPRPAYPPTSATSSAKPAHILAWLTGDTDEIPVDDDNRGRFIGARDDYARTDDDIRQVRDHALPRPGSLRPPRPHGPQPTPRHPWRWDAAWMNAAWLRGVRDLLDWVLGERAASPLCDRTVGLPTAYDLTYEDAAADDVVLQGRPGGLARRPRHLPSAAVRRGHPGNDPLATRRNHNPAREPQRSQPLRNWLTAEPEVTNGLSEVVTSESA